MSDMTISIDFSTSCITYMYMTPRAMEILSNIRQPIASELSKIQEWKIKSSVIPCVRIEKRAKDINLEKELLSKWSAIIKNKESFATLYSLLKRMEIFDDIAKYIAEKIVFGLFLILLENF